MSCRHFRDKWLEDELGQGRRFYDDFLVLAGQWHQQITLTQVHLLNMMQQFSQDIVE